MNFFVEKKKNKIAIFLRIILIAVIISCVVTPIYFETSPDRLKDVDEQVLDDGFDVDINGTIYEDVSLSTFSAGMQNKGDVVTLTYVFPGDTHISNPVLKLYSIHSLVDVYLDGVLYYSYGYDRYAEGKLVGYGNNFIELPYNYAGMTMTVVYTVVENNAFEGIPAMYIWNGFHSFIHAFSSARLALALSMFLMIFGVVFIIVSLFMLAQNREFNRVFCIAIFSFFIGVWTLCNNDTITFFTDDLYIKVFLEYMSLYAIPIPFTYYFEGRISRANVKKPVKIIYWAMFIEQIILFIVAFYCNQRTTIHFPVFLPIFQIASGLGAIFIGGLIITDKTRTKSINRVSIMGFALAILIVVFELIRFNLAKSFTGFSANEYNTYIGWAAIIIVLSLMIDFVDYTGDILYEQAEKNILKKMAYEDELTGLLNRRGFAEAVEKLSNHDDYAVVSIDMNMLKLINDSLGHLTGDEAIRVIGSAIQKAFSEVDSIVARTGGDEFAVLLPNAEAKEVEENLEFLKDYLESKDKNTEYPLSASYGYAMKSEFESDASYEKVMRLADDRMYKMKKASKKGRSV